VVILVKYDIILIMKIDKKGLITFGLIIVVAGGVFGLSNYVVPQILVTMTKAAPATKVSINDSYVIGGKILAKADGVDKCRVDVFVVDSTGKGITGKRVSLEGLESIVESVKMSGDNGLASFEITSLKEGQFELNAGIEGVPMPRTVKVTFRN